MYGVMREDAWESGFLCFGVVVVAEEMGDESVLLYINIERVPGKCVCAMEK